MDPRKTFFRWRDWWGRGAKKRIWGQIRNCFADCRCVDGFEDAVVVALIDFAVDEMRLKKRAVL